MTPARFNVSRTIATRPADICYTSFPKVGCSELPSASMAQAHPGRRGGGCAAGLPPPHAGAARAPGAAPCCCVLQSGSTWLANTLYLILNDGIEPEGRPMRSFLHWMESSWTFPRRHGGADSVLPPAPASTHCDCAWPAYLWGGSSGPLCGATWLPPGCRLACLPACSREEVDALPSPRIFKSHMPHHMALAGGPAHSPCKYIYVRGGGSGRAPALAGPRESMHHTCASAPTHPPTPLHMDRSHATPRTWW